jgi:hypothetical protein
MLEAVDALVSLALREGRELTADVFPLSPSWAAGESALSLEAACCAVGWAK